MELDYQMALILQHRFEQEAGQTEQSDSELAKQLQEQFEQEAAVEQPPSSLVYHQPKKGSDSTKSLIDPSWELVDPTPDIHNLFIAFDQRFFWNKLVAVCVSWSKKMTSCAGICSYSGRGGLCSITLSEPLLKLRPRKDLVETLLHEMIHAYLFVTHNNRDRDGHGPEFHKHMYRINNEAGTSITVYHNFHDEVRLYQQHWWRCDGPCQHRKPFFGMVRRATNRAPGPNDRWWAEHLRTCGGTFIKVKEPEKKKQEKKNETKSVKSKDIRDFMGGNVKGFKDLKNGVVRGKSNSSSTIVVTKNTKTSETTFKPTIFNASTSTILKTETNSSSASTSTSTKPSDDYVAVRNHWANKFNNANKRQSSEESSTVSKIPKLFGSSPTSTQKNPNSGEFCECPVCHQRVLMADLNQHLDQCLLKSPEERESVDLTDSFHEEEDTKECPLCNKKIVASKFDTHVEKCLMEVYNGVEEKLAVPKAQEETVSCLACGKKIVKSELNSHLDECMVDIFDDEESKDKEVCDKNNSQFNCPFCLKLVEESEMKEHIDGCLMADNLAEAFADDDF
ncbi:DNA-dependent metalloprotease dvc-1 [Tribolium castaneum]|uniref:DNA-dependent metalloprotease dvc-1 n=1 Tax=Tribolium castaneum TaxID=7070 RepID=UPI0030FEE13F